MNLSEHFTLEEFTRTEHRNIDNSLPPELIPEAQHTAMLMERIRGFLNVPIFVTSGYRCPDLNQAVGSKPTSDHIRMQAIDFVAPAYGTPLQIALALSSKVNDLGIGQLIHEFGRWVHVSTNRPMRALDRIITIDSTGVRVGVLPVA